MGYVLSGRTALVTGANRGIGEAIVDALIAAGVKKVYAAARNISTLDPLVDRAAAREDVPGGCRAGDRRGHHGRRRGDLSRQDESRHGPGLLRGSEGTRTPGRRGPGRCLTTRSFDASLCEAR